MEGELSPADVGVYGFLAVVDGSDLVAECDEGDNVATWSEGCP